MRRPAAIALLLLAATLAALVVAGCGSDSEPETEVIEGEPLELDGLLYNVQITRFLNPADAEDEAYLAGQPPAPSGQAYLGVFMRIENETEDTAEVSADMTVIDTRDSEYEPAPSESVYALELPAQVEPEGELPAPGTPAASGPIKGAMVLFLVDESAADNRPLKLEVPSSSGDDGEVELDI